MKVGIIGHSINGNDLEVVSRLLRLLNESDVSFAMYKPLCNNLRSREESLVCDETFASPDEFQAYNFHYAITLGGDGTILKAMTLIGNTGVPVMGINLGRLGFLASIEKKFIEKAVSALIHNRFNIDERSMLHLETNRPLFSHVPFALNDFTLHKRDTSSMISINTYINGDYLNTYWADGVIISTPTGSTGYSLSCGGPIIFPGSGNFVITPVAPHNLNVRPIVISDSSVISFEIKGRTKSFLCSMDSRVEKIDSTHQLAVRKCDFPARLINLLDYSYLANIRQKLAWGIDKRN